MGKSQPWTSEGATTDNNPPTIVDSVAPESYYWDDMLVAKKLLVQNHFAIPRRIIQRPLHLICIVMMLVQYNYLW